MKNFLSMIKIENYFMGKVLGSLLALLGSLQPGGSGEITLISLGPQPVLVVFQ